MLRKTGKFGAKKFGWARTCVTETAFPQTKSEVLTQIKSLIVASHGCNLGHLIWSSWPCELLEGQLDNCPTLLCTCEHPSRSCTESRLFQGQKQFIVLFLPPSLTHRGENLPWQHRGCFGGSIWGRFGVVLGGRFGVVLGSFWGRFGVDLGSKADSGSICGRFGVDSGSIWGRFGVAFFCPKLPTEPTVENLEFGRFL